MVAVSTYVMEIKKSQKADLERGRLRRFLFGLAVSLVLFFAVLEFPIQPADPLEDPELVEILTSDQELPPFIQQENMVALAPKAEPKPTVRLEVVEEDAEAPEEEEEPEPEQPLEGDPVDELPEEEPVEPQQADDEVLSFRVVEDLPQFPGGYGEFMKWLTRNLRYPKNAQEQKIQGRVVAEFIVNKDGSITDVRIVRPLHEACDNEVLRVLRMMPRWTAGIQNDKPCRTKVCIPIVYRQ